MRKIKNPKTVGEHWINNSNYFERCINHIHDYFYVYNYTWQGSDKIPTREEIKKNIKMLMKDVIVNDGYASTGRIRVDYDKENDWFEVSIVL